MCTVHGFHTSEDVYGPLSTNYLQPTQAAGLALRHHSWLFHLHLLSIQESAWLPPCLWLSTSSTFTNDLRVPVLFNDCKIGKLSKVKEQWPPVASMSII